MKALKLFAVALTVFLAGCMNDQFSRYPEYEYSKLPKFNVEVANVIVESRYDSPLSHPSVEHLAPVTIQKSFTTWVNRNLNPIGTSKVLKIVINNASMKEVKLPAHKRDLKNNVEYIAKLEVQFQVYDKESITPIATMEIDVSRSVTGDKDAAPIDKEEIFYNLTRKVVFDTTYQIEKNIYNYLGNYLN